MPNGIAKSLAGVPLGASAIVRRVASARSIARRLMELGLVPGTRVTMMRVAPFGDPIELRVRNYALSIRRTEGQPQFRQVYPLQRADRRERQGQ